MRSAPAKALASAAFLASPFLAAGLAATWLAWLHWREMAPFGGVVCGQSPILHCAACYVAIAAFGMATAVFLWRLAPGAARLRSST